jgi:hypothetical protein
MKIVISRIGKGFDDAVDKGVCGTDKSGLSENKQGVVNPAIQAGINDTYENPKPVECKFKERYNLSETASLITKFAGESYPRRPPKIPQ